MPGMTFRSPIFAVDRIPQRTLPPFVCAMTCPSPAMGCDAGAADPKLVPRVPRSSHRQHMTRETEPDQPIAIVAALEEEAEGLFKDMAADPAHRVVAVGSRDFHVGRLAGR